MSEVDWQNAYKVALLECDPAMLQDRIDAARNAIRQRLTVHREALSKREFDDMENALRILRFLVRETVSSMAK
jgi:hypothetical protein